MRKAFTLIELLVVISIIALLIAILLPVLSKARYSANIVKCQVAVRSIAQVQLSYAIDHDEFFPEAGYRYGSAAGETGGWFDAMTKGARIRPWQLVGNGYDLRPIYYDYMQNNDQDAVMHCPLIAPKFLDYNTRDDNILSYMLYVGNNYRAKHFYYEDVGAYERLNDTWSPEGEHDAEFTLLASDFAFGNFAPHGVQDENGDPYQGALVSHPAPNGSTYEHVGEINDAGGYIVVEDQNAPSNFADADGSVQTFQINATSYQDTDNWVVNRHHRGKDALLPRDLAR